VLKCGRAQEWTERDGSIVLFIPAGCMKIFIRQYLLTLVTVGKPVQMLSRFGDEAEDSRQKQAFRVASHLGSPQQNWGSNTTWLYAILGLIPWEYHRFVFTFQIYPQELALAQRESTLI
jgi:hypothetical protein